jgi:hypothetical protein
MLTLPVPDFFQDDSEDALRSRVEWLEAEVGLGTPFFGRLLRTDEGAFTAWKERRAALPNGAQVGLRELWDLMVHILSFVNFDTTLARRMLEHVAQAAGPERGVSDAPPWTGSSIKRYLETRGLGGIDDVSYWVTSFRFGAPSLTPEEEVPCPSSRG